MEAEDRPEFLELLLGVLFDPNCGFHEPILVRVRQSRSRMVD